MNETSKQIAFRMSLKCVNEVGGSALMLMHELREIVVSETTSEITFLLMNGMNKSQLTCRFDESSRTGEVKFTSGMFSEKSHTFNCRWSDAIQIEAI